MASLTGDALKKYIDELVAKSRKAQKTYEMTAQTNRACDEVIRAIGMETCNRAQELCQDAIDETGYGNLKDKIMKLTSVTMLEWTVCRGQNTIEYEDSPMEPGVKVLPKPMGVIGAIMPSTNPAATIIGNSMMALKGRNSIIIAPHPASVAVSVKMVNYLRDALKRINMPEDLIQCIGEEAASIEATDYMMTQTDCNLATGGKGMVKAVYSSGKPGIGVGQGNCQEIIDTDQTDEDLEQMAEASITGRSMDNGVPCTGDQTQHVPAPMLDKYLKIMQKHGAFLIDKKEDVDKIRELAFPNGTTRINRAIVGKLPPQIGKMCGIDIPDSARVILLPNQAWGDQDVLCREILCPIMRYTTYEKFEDAVDHAVTNLYNEGAGHSSSIWTHNEDHIEYAAKRVPVGRFHVNQPTGGGANGLTQTITVGCGTWGGTSVSENVAYYHLLNKTKVTTQLKNPAPWWEASWDDFEPFQRELAD